MTTTETWLQTVKREARFSEAATDLAREIHAKCGARAHEEFWRLIREAQTNPAPVNR